MYCDPAHSDCNEALMHEAAEVTAQSYKSAWFVYATVMTGFGGYFWKQYPQMVNLMRWIDDRFDDDVQIDKEDREWALGTKEIRRWDQTSRLMYTGYGAGMLLYVLNKQIDDEGGELHYVFLRYLQVLTYLMPITLAIQGARIYQAFNRTPEWDESDDAYACGDGNCHASDTYFRFYLYPNDDDIDSDAYLNAFLADQSIQTHQAMLWILIVLQANWGHFFYGNLKADFDAKRLQREQDHQWLEEHEEALLELMDEEEFEALF